MTLRMFVAVTPPADLVAELSDFLDSRHGMPWIDPEQWHITLAFMAAVPEHRVDDLTVELSGVAGRHQPFELALTGAGAFPHAAKASVLWLAAEGAGLDHLARSCRAAAAHVGAPPDGKGFTGHLTLARLRRPIEATKWLRVLDTFRGSWPVDHIELIESHLGEGPNRRPRYETVAALPLGAPPEPGPVRGS